MAKTEKMYMGDYVISASIIDIISGCSNGSIWANAYNSVLLDCAVDKGYIEHIGEIIRLTEKGKSLHRKLQECVLDDIRESSR